ncbi:MAG: hypothetical protein ABEJ97_04985 [Halobellus sp.]
MECPRCGRPLTTITIAGGDGEAAYCEHCRFSGVTSEFEPSPESEESWEEAIDRFRESTGANAGEADTEARAGEGSDASEDGREAEPESGGEPGGRGDAGESVDDDAS